jgi:hypothetical protein
VHEPAPEVFTNGKSTLTLENGKVRFETGRDGTWSVEARVEKEIEAGGVRIIVIDGNSVEMELPGSMRGEMPVDALTVNNMRDGGNPLVSASYRGSDTDAGAPEEGRFSIIIVPRFGNGPEMGVRIAHELTHAMVFRYAMGRGIERPSAIADEALAYAAQIAYGNVRAGLADLLEKQAFGERELDGATSMVVRNLPGELRQALGKDFGLAGEEEIRRAANTVLDRISADVFGRKFADVVDVLAYRRYSGI